MNKIIKTVKERNNRERKSFKLRSVIYVAVIILGGCAFFIFLGILSGLGNAFVNKILFSQ